MALRLPNKWVWDFWLAQDGPDYHIFYLQASRSLPDESLEAPHLTLIQGRYHLFFSTSSSMYSARRLQQTGLALVTGTHYLVADNLLGPFHFSTDQFLVGDTVGSFYSGKLVQGSGGEWLFLAFHNFNDKGEFIGEISNPLSVEIDNKGNVIVG